MKKQFFKDSTILITGGSGSWGNELTKQLLEKYAPARIKIYSRGEHKQVEMKRKFQNKKIEYIIGDVRDGGGLKLAMRRVDYVFHLAALKHVPVCEENPWEAVKTNIIGTQNVIDAAVINNVKKVVDVSTDKAVDPFNLYGVSKACGEKLIIAANQMSKNTRFVCVRGGNVVGTNGSVVPLFKEQLRQLNEVTITDPEMTRFLMRVEEAIGLVIHATQKSIGGEVFVMKMPACKIKNLARVMIDNLGNEKTKEKIIGIRPGEKMYEVLVSRYEMSRAFDFGKFYVILPQLYMEKTERYYQKKKNLVIKNKEFNSQNTHRMTYQEIKGLLNKDNWFGDNSKNEAIKYLKTLNKNDLENFFISEGWVKNSK